VIALVCDCLDVLYSACDLIGAELNAPEDADQPILGVVGPAAPREVLASLLRDSQFGYAMSGSSNDSNAVASLTVFPKDKDSNANPKDENADAAPPAKRLADFAARAQAAVAAAAAGATTDSSPGSRGH